jgi:hypothetical protein
MDMLFHLLQVIGTIFIGPQALTSQTSKSIDLRGGHKMICQLTLSPIILKSAKLLM